MKTFKDFCKEETTTSGVGGLGFNTGNPAVNDDETETYATTNSLASDKENGFLSKYLQQNQNKLAHKIGFRSYDPKELKKDKK